MTERIIETDGIELCAEAFGDASDPAVLLIMGIGASMLWWEEEFCRQLAAEGRFVIRYDHRDTGRSVTYPIGSLGYTGADLVDDAARVLDGHGIAAAHVIGVSAGGGLAQLLALDHPDRVRSLVLIGTSPATPGDRRLPPPTDEFGRFVSTAQVDWSDTSSVVDYMVAYARLLNGGRRRFEEAAARDLVARDIRRARDYAAVQNHDSIPEGDRPHPPLSASAVLTLVVHGTADPMFPLAHGEALAAEIPGARLMSLDGAGHGVHRDDWPVLSRAIREHTSA